MSEDILQPVRSELIIRRVALGLTQHQLAAALGVTQGAVGQLETPSRPGATSKVETVTRWAAALDARFTVGLDYVSVEEAAGRRAYEAHMPALPVRWPELTGREQEHWIAVARAARR